MVRGFDVCCDQVPLGRMTFLPSLRDFAFVGTLTHR